MEGPRTCCHTAGVWGMILCLSRSQSLQRPFPYRTSVVGMPPDGASHFLKGKAFIYHWGVCLVVTWILRGWWGKPLYRKLGRTLCSSEQREPLGCVRKIEERASRHGPVWAWGDPTSDFKSWFLDSLSTWGEWYFCLFVLETGEQSWFCARLMWWGRDPSTRM